MKEKIKTFASAHKVLLIGIVIVLVFLAWLYFLPTESPTGVSPVATEAEKSAQQSLGVANDARKQIEALESENRGLQKEVAEANERYESLKDARKVLESRPSKPKRPATRPDISDAELRARLAKHGVNLP